MRRGGQKIRKNILKSFDYSFPSSRSKYLIHTNEFLNLHAGVQVHRLRVSRPEPGRRRAAPPQHAPQHQPGQPRQRRTLRHRQPGQLILECGHQTRDKNDDIQRQT